MSSILKALRKIEEERRVASHSAPDLRMDQGHSSREGWPFLPLAVGIVLGAVCVGLFSFWSSSETPAVVTLPVQQPIRTGVESKQIVRSPVTTEEKMPSAAVKPLAVAVQEPIAAPLAEAVNIREVIIPVETMPVISDVRVISEQSKTQKQQTGIVSERKPSSGVAGPESVATTATKTAVVDPVLVKTKALPGGVHLKVTETFYHEDPANSMAVVNDLPVMIGTFIDSAMVLEIHSNKVVFRIDDDSYDIPVSSNQQP